MNFYKHYIGDFQRDTSHLSLTERGAYLALIHHYYATETPLPTDHTALCRIAGAFTKVERDAVKRAAGFFEVRDGQLWHKRIEAELEKQDGRCDKNREIALAREAKKRAAKEPQTEHESSTKRAQNVPRNEHENSTIPDPEPQPDKTSSLRSDVNVRDVFAEFWQAFPKKVGKGDAEKAWKKIQRPAETLALILEALAWQKVSPQWTKDGGQYVPNPSTYLNQKRWEDEPQKVVRMVESEARNLSFAERERLARQRRWEEMTNEKWPGDQPAAIDVMATEVGGQHVIAA